MQKLYAASLIAALATPGVLSLPVGAQGLPLVIDEKPLVGDFNEEPTFSEDQLLLERSHKFDLVCIP